MSTLEREIATQPDVWRQAAATAVTAAALMPTAGARVAVIGCGTSHFIGQAFAELREAAGQGESDAMAASEAVLDGRYDAILALSRSGETTEVARALESAPSGIPTTAVCGVADSTVGAVADRVIDLGFADEESIVQTRFATGALAFFRAFLGEDVTPLAAVADGQITAALPLEPAAFGQFVFLGTGWSIGVANEAALKLREAAGAWSESYPAMEYRHGPISASGVSTAVWSLGDVDPSVLADASEAGATVIDTGFDPLVDLILVQRAAVDLARSRGLDPHEPAHLSRAVILS